jgi:hypothetical protein
MEKPLDTYSVVLMVMTPTGVSFMSSVQIPAESPELAMQGAIMHLMTKGSQVTLVPGSEPIPCPVACAVPQSCNKIQTTGIAIAHSMPKGGITH